MDDDDYDKDDNEDNVTTTTSNGDYGDKIDNDSDDGYNDDGYEMITMTSDLHNVVLIHSRATSAQEARLHLAVINSLHACHLLICDSQKQAC